MKATATSREKREAIAAARRYRRDGYKVSGPDNLTNAPEFLGDLLPDLVAERDDDKVIVEIKRATAIRGSNEIIEIAEKVAAQPGWRFELIAVSDTNTIAEPDLAWSTENARRLLAHGFAKPAFVLAYATLDRLLAHAAARDGRNPANVTPAGIIRDLVVRGVLDEPTRRRIGDAQDRRNFILHDASAISPNADEVEALLALAATIQRETQRAAEPYAP